MVGNSGNDGLAKENPNGDDGPTIEYPNISADDVSTVAKDIDDDSAPVIY